MTCADEPLHVTIDGLALDGRLRRPRRPRGVVVVVPDGFARATAPEDDPEPRALLCAGIAALELELLSSAERGDARRLLDSFLLARRLEATTNTVARHPALRALPVGYLADGPVAAGALLASVDDPRVGAIVCRNGRPELVEGILHRVSAPTLLIADPPSLARARGAMDLLQCRTELVARATREPGPALADHPSACAAWFRRHFADRRPAPRAKRPGGGMEFGIGGSVQAVA
jgi:hypothetical protein